jgi:asparagine synthase (glutamine-hydrolysing)
MCGLVAFIAARGGAAAYADAIAAANEALHHRGPDETGLKVLDDDVVFGFKRLSIIDLVRSHQPLSYADGRYTLVFNGEIYNYLELREELRHEHGAEFATDGDTEVIAAAYHHWGRAAAGRLRGMFAFVLWDAQERLAFAARDPFGIKPLYHALAPEGLYLASEKKALMSLVDNRLDGMALAHYLTMQYVPEPGSMHEGIHRLGSGESLSYAPGGVSIVDRYWRPRFRPRAERPYERIQQALRDSVSVHLRSDVPVGAFLSSGIDSTAIVALAREIKPDLRTFTAALDVPGWSELDVAAESAAALGVANEPVAVNAQMMMDALPEIVWHLDDPLADPSLVPLYYLARRASQDVTVVLSGEGADELFGGYPLYREPLSLRPITRLPSALRRGLGGLARVIPEGMRGRSLLERGSLPLEERYDGGARLFNFAERCRMLRATVDTPNLVANLYAECAELDDVTRMQYVDLFTWLRGDILVKADRMSMAHSLELRVPFLDPEVFAAAAAVPTSLKLPSGSAQTKYALRRALDGTVPESIVNRPKLGFPTPVRVWLRTDMYDWAREILSDGAADEVIDLSYPRELLEEQRRGNGDHSRKIWSALVFSLWYDRFVTEGTSRPGPSTAAAPRRG